MIKLPIEGGGGGGGAIPPLFFEVAPEGWEP